MTFQSLKLIARCPTKTDLEDPRIHPPWAENWFSKTKTHAPKLIIEEAFFLINTCTQFTCKHLNFVCQQFEEITQLTTFAVLSTTKHNLSTLNTGGTSWNYSEKLLLSLRKTHESISPLRKQLTILGATTDFPTKLRLRHGRRWRFTTQIWIVFLIGWSKFPTR